MTRDKKGRFDKGNAGGPGRPKRPTEVAYLNVLMNNCSLEDWGEICSQTVIDAKAGDAKAREWLGKHLVGATKNGAPTPMMVQQFALTGIDPIHLERAQTLRRAAAFNPSDFMTNIVEKDERTAKQMMIEDD